MSCSPKLYGWEHAYILYPRELLGWQTLSTSHGVSNGYQHLKDGLFSLISTDVVTLTINCDGVDHSFSIPSTGGVEVKNYVLFDVMKGRLYSYRFTSPSVFRFFVYDSHIRFKPWGAEGAYQTMNPFAAGATVV